MQRLLCRGANLQGRARLRIVATVLASLLISVEVIAKCTAQTIGCSHTAAQPLTKSSTPATASENAFHDMRNGVNSLRSEIPVPHSVKLFWKPSVPSGHSVGNSIIGYVVYRSTVPNDPKPMPINSTQVTGTTFVDSNVEPGKVYYYVTRAVNARGILSPPSNEARAKIPN